ncbi:SDR family NAD(P)-dependent oxidoreductase [Falsiroseomonas sp. HW251]|uniref:SDR family NAD(P)-dependent oxidoreductase n=1 Tax=Falsiroseomonas sp. HW251 TaxID=3390998 RepID=UPI003D30F5DF
MLRQGSAGYEELNVLVTGADGFIGSHLVEGLARAGATVTALSLYNSFDSHGWLDDIDASLREGIHAVRGDVRDASLMRGLVARQDIVFHLAALIAIPYSYAAPQSYVETNILGTLNVLEAVRASHVTRVVHTSTSEVYGTALVCPISETHRLQGQSPYSASKIGADMMAEAYARSFDLPVAILRPFNTFGPRQSERAVIASVLRQALDPNVSSIKVGDLSTIRDFTFVADTVAAFLAIGIGQRIEYGTPYNAGSGHAVTIGEVAALALEATGSHKPIESESQRMRPEQSEVRELLADASRFSAATGWRPRTSLREGLVRTADWWRSRLERGRVRRERDYVT